MKRLADKPFALLGINSDPDREETKKIVKEEELIWRSWWDMNVDGRIHKQWNVIVRPATYVIDPQGVIRYKNITGNELDEAVDKLLGEIEKPAP